MAKIIVGSGCCSDIQHSCIIRTYYDHIVKMLVVLRVVNVKMVIYHGILRNQTFVRNH